MYVPRDHIPVTRDSWPSALRNARLLRDWYLKNPSALAKVIAKHAESVVERMQEGVK